MKNKKIFNLKGLLIAFFLMMFAPAAAYADDSVDVNSIDNCNSDSDSVAESKCKEGKVSSESETITDETASFEGTYDNEEEVLNKKEKKTKKSKSKSIANPQTGDNILVYAILLTMSAGALTAESICLRKEM